MLCRLADATGHERGGDFSFHADGRLARLADKSDPAGWSMPARRSTTRRSSRAPPPSRISLNLYYDRAIAAGRLFGHVMEDGHWFTVGTPQALPLAEAKLKQLGAARAD